MPLTYKDKTFCTNKTCKKECPDRLTDKIIEQARKAGMYIACGHFDCNKEEGENDI